MPSCNAERGNKGRTGKNGRRRGVIQRRRGGR